jgi:hypothetical protein
MKFLKHRPNILERLQAKKLFGHSKSTELVKDKGKFMGSCNRSACLKPGAEWYNHSTQKYYCEACADWLNTDRFNRKDAQEMWGHTLCTLGEYDHGKYQRLHDLHRNAQIV